MSGDGQSQTCRRYAVITNHRRDARHPATAKSRDIFSTHHPTPLRIGRKELTHCSLDPTTSSSPLFPSYSPHQPAAACCLLLLLTTPPPPPTLLRSARTSDFSLGGDYCRASTPLKPDNPGKATTRQCSSCPALAGSDRVVVVGGAGGCWCSPGRLCFSSGAS